MTDNARAPLMRLSPGQVELAAAAKERATRRADPRERATEFVVGLLFLVAAGAFWMVEDTPAPAWDCLLLSGVMAALVRIEFQVGEGHTRPVILGLIPMLVLLPAGLVPLLVAGAHVAARLPEVVTRRAPAGRLWMMIGDSWFVVGPAMLVAVVGLPDDAGGVALLAGGVYVAHVVTDVTVSSLRLWAAVGVDPREDLAAYAWVYLVDLMLAPVGALAAIAGHHGPIAVAAVLPLAVLMAVFAHERRGRVENAVAVQRLTEESRDRLQSIVQHASDLILILDPDGTLTSVTGSVKAIFGADPGEDGRHGSLLDRVHPDDSRRVADFLHIVAAKPAGESAEDEWRMRYADGSHRHIAAVATNLVTDERVGGLVITARDVEARRAFEEQLRHRAFHDQLTGLANRSLFFDRVEHALLRANRSDAPVAVLFVDIDDFKPVNDRLGHAAGDELLQGVAQRLGTAMRSADTVARLGGDEFGVLLEGEAAPRAVEAAQRLLAAMQAPLEVAGETVQASVSVGVAVRGQHVRDVEELLREGDHAMYAAKRNGKARVELYTPDLHAPVLPGRAPSWYARSDEQRQEIVSLLEDPAALRIVFQPIMDLRTGRIAGYEALTRVQRNPYRPPDQWFAQAHRCGLGYALEAAAVAAALATPGRPAGTYLALNLSPSSLTAPEVTAVLPERLDDLVIEVTENELISGDPAIDAAITALRERGARLAVDDTGAGYAGLTHVMRLGPDLIKLDRVLTAGIENDPVRAALVSSFVRYARRIDATVCSEGIETEAELRCLADLDIGYGQGYFICRPSEPWAALDGVASEACDTSFRAAFDDLGADASRDPDRRLEFLSHALARVATPADLDALMRPLADELGADAARVVPGDPGEPSQLLAGDPEADPAEATALTAAGYRARLVLPIGNAGRLELLGVIERPWTRFHVGRARILSHQLIPVLDRVAYRPVPAS